MKGQVQMELLQLVHTSPKNINSLYSKSKLAAMVKRIQDQEDIKPNEDVTSEIKLNKNDENRRETVLKSTVPPPPPPPPPLINTFSNENSRSSTPSRSKLLKSPLEINNNFSCPVENTVYSERNSSHVGVLSDKFSSLVCPQPFHLQKTTGIKKTFSLQQPSFSTQTKLNTSNTKLKTSFKDFSRINSPGLPKNAKLDAKGMSIEIKIEKSY